MKILGVDQSTTNTAMVVIEFDLDSFLFEDVKVIGLEVVSPPRNLDLQSRVVYLHSSRSIQDLVLCHEPEIMIRECHDPLATRSHQMSMVSGIIDCQAFHNGFRFKDKNYMQVTPGEWRGICLMDDTPQIKGKPKEFLKVFYDRFPVAKMLGTVDLAEAFCMAYAVGVLTFAKKNVSYLEGLQEQQYRNIIREGKFKDWTLR